MVFLTGEHSMHSKIFENYPVQVIQAEPQKKFFEKFAEEVT